MNAKKQPAKTQPKTKTFLGRKLVGEYGDGMWCNDENESIRIAVREYFGGSWAVEVDSDDLGVVCATVDTERKARADVVRQLKRIRAEVDALLGDRE